MQQEHKKISIVKPIAQLVAIVLVLVGVSYAWFYTGNKGTAGPLDASIVSSVDVSISNADAENPEWGTKFDVNAPDINVRISEYSGNGRHLYKPFYNNGRLKGFFEQPSNSAKEYVEFTVAVKSDSTVDLYLTSESFVTPVNINGTDNLSEDLKLSKDYISGAVRVALFDAEDENSTTVVWAPNSTVDKDSRTVSGNPEQTYSFINAGKFSDDGSEDFSDVTTTVAAGTNNGVYNDGKFCFIWGDIQAGSAMQPVLHIDTESGEEAVKNLTVRIWIEGTDREAIKEFIGGRFKVNLDFKAEQSKSN